MGNDLTLLDSSLLDHSEKLAEITHWLRVMNRPNGWHYDLDHVWILCELEKAGIPKGSTILDAGAGQGIMQFLLAARGYNVISLDFSARTIPSRSCGIFDIHGSGEAKLDYSHPYMEFISYGDVNNRKWPLGRIFSHPRRILRLPRRVVRDAFSFFNYVGERFFNDHSDYGSITYLRAPFHDIPLDQGTVDSVISVSAIEHADIELFGKNIMELRRILKDGAPLLMTTSATPKDENEFHEKSSGWCFSLAHLQSFFDDCTVNFDAQFCERSLLDSRVFLNRLDPYYHLDRDSFCYRKQIASLPYLPVAIKAVSH